jgi:hypothetical protein
MTHSELLRYILEEMAKSGKSLHTLKEIHETLLPGEPFESYRTNWSNWIKGRAQRINNARAKRLIEQTLGFDGYVWNADTQTQKRILRQAVKCFLTPVPKVDLSELLPKNTPLSNAQTTLLLQIRKSYTKEEILKLLEESDFLKAEPENQIFLLELLSLLYKQGMYDFLLERVFPALLPHNAENFHVKIFKAHTYGSLKEPEYLKAVFLLQTIEANSEEDILEIKTGMLSNLRRYMLEGKDLNKNKLLETLTVLRQYYNDIFEHVERHHYYPGVNLMYMLKLSMLLSPNDAYIDSDDIAQIYYDASDSIEADKISNIPERRYYAFISDTEMRLLTNKPCDMQRIGSWLENEKPAISYVERTLRMMRFFVKSVKKFASSNVEEQLKTFTEVIEMLEGYVLHPPV